MKNIAIYGFGGFGREVACLLNHINKASPEWNLIGFFDDGVASGVENKYGKVLGDIETVNKYSEPLNIVITVAEIKSRRKIVEQITNMNIRFPNIIAPDIILHDQQSLKMGRGNVILFNCIITCDVKLGDFNLLNNRVILGHDLQLGNYNTIMPSAKILGNCKVGNSNFFGVDSVVLQGLEIGSETRIGAGSLVMKSTLNGYLYHGNPARKMLEL